MENTERQTVTLSDAMRVLCHELEHDQDYFYGWQSNIANAIMDEDAPTYLPYQEFRMRANRAAERFLRNLIIIQRSKNGHTERV